jgi:hypothetical protein
MPSTQELYNSFKEPASDIAYNKFILSRPKQSINLAIPAIDLVPVYRYRT